MSVVAHRGKIAHCLSDPSVHGSTALETFEDGVLLLDEGRVAALGPAAELLPQLGESVQRIEHSDEILVPGFIDTHLHFPQCDIIASHGTQLLEWLNTYTFPSELRFGDAAIADETARFFCDQLLLNGTTTAMVFGSVHAQSAESLFAEAKRRKLRMIAGKVMMDRHAPEGLCDTPESSYRDSAALIERWHGVDRLAYAVTPRFAPTSSPEQLQLASQLLKAYPDLYMQTHVSENTDEVAWVKTLFPDRKNYLDVYDHYGLLGPRSVFAHAIYLTEPEWQRLADTQSNVSHCPTSNLFIGSGLFPLQEASKHSVGVGIGTDMGGGDSFSQLRTINEAYKVQQLLGHNLSPEHMLYQLTLGGAASLCLDDKIGNFAIGKEADFVCLNTRATALIERRLSHAQTFSEALFALMMLGDDRAIAQTYVLGEPQLPH